MERKGFTSVTRVSLIIIVLLMSSLAIFYALKKPTTLPPQAQNKVVENETKRTQKSTIDTSTWKTYENKKFQFSLRYPTNWSVYEGLSPDLDPVISFYDQQSPPPIHHYDPSTAVVILPEGSRNEGMLCGKSREIQFDLSEPTSEAIDCLLSDDTPWASKILYDLWTNDGWKGGFIWANTRIENLTVSQQGTELIRHGKINIKDRIIEEEIVSSFHFTSQKAKTDTWYSYINFEDGYEIQYPTGYSTSFGSVTVGKNLLDESSEPDLGTTYISPSNFTDFSSAVIEMGSNASSTCDDLLKFWKPIDKRKIGERMFNKQSFFEDNSMISKDSYMNIVYSLKNESACYIVNLRIKKLITYGRDYDEMIRTVERMLATLKFLY